MSCPFPRTQNIEEAQPKGPTLFSTKCLIWKKWGKITEQLTSPFEEEYTFVDKDRTTIEVPKKTARKALLGGKTNVDESADSKK
nr:hypothetical protein [Tanacetum cinerariifolium]